LTAFDELAFFGLQGVFVYSGGYSMSGTGKETAKLSNEQILKVTKEIVIKFIEVGRITPANFDETFNQIHKSIRNGVNKS